MRPSHCKTRVGIPNLTVLDENKRNPLLNEVTRQLAPRLVGKDGRWTIDYTRLRFRVENP